MNGENYINFYTGRIPPEKCKQDESNLLQRNILKMTLNWVNIESVIHFITVSKSKMYQQEVKSIGLV